MKSSIISSLSFLMIANSTIKSSLLLRNQYEMNLAILPRFSLSQFKFQNLWFKQINLIHFAPVTFNSCRFGSVSVYIESNHHLMIQNCANLSGYIKVTDRNILVQSTKLSDNFKTFKIINGHGIFQNSLFTSYSKNPVVDASKSEIVVQNCNFSNCSYGGIKTSMQSNLTVSNSIFSTMKADEGAAIYFDGDYFEISYSLFKNCIASKAGGAIKVTKSLSTLISYSSFSENISPRGNSIFLFNMKNINLLNCSIPSSIHEIYDQRKAKHIKFGDDGTENAVPSFSETEQFSPSLFIDESTSLGSFTSSFTFTPPRNDTINVVTKSTKKNKTYLIFIIVICAVVVIIAIAAVTAILVQKKKNQVYPSDYDGEDEEPKKTTVTIANINDVDA